MVDVLLTDRFRKELDLGYRTVPLLRRKFDAAGLRPGAVRRASDLRRLPPTTRSEYREQFPTGVLATGRTLTERFVHRSLSSGTVGDRTTSVTNTYTLAERMNASLEIDASLAALLRRAPLRAARYAAPNCSAVECASPHVEMRDRVLPDGTLVLPVAHDLFATPEAMVDHAIEELIEWQPDYLYCDPTHLALLVRASRQRGIEKLPGRAVVLTYTMATRPAFRQIRGFFAMDVPIAEVVSMSEFGWVGMRCPAFTMHLNNTSFFLEFLVDGRAAEPGELADLYVSTIGDRLAPRLRYHTGDLYTVLDGCQCGHAFPAVRFAGRRRDLVRRPEGLVLTPRDVDDLIGCDPRVDAYRLYQRADNHVSLEFLGLADAAPTLRDTLTSVLGTCVRVEATAAVYLPGQRSGKFQSCVSDSSAQCERQNEQR